MSNCFRASDNKYKDAPPRMSDGRHFTDYRPSCDLNSDVRRDNSITDSFEARLFLQRNAEQLMDINRNKACEKNCNGVCGQDVVDDVQNENFTSTMLPELNKQRCNDTYCEVYENNPNGLGLGRQYFTVEQEEQVAETLKKAGENNCGPSNSDWLVNNYATFEGFEGVINDNYLNDFKQIKNNIKDIRNDVKNISMKMSEPRMSEQANTTLQSSPYGSVLPKVLDEENIKKDDEIDPSKTISNKINLEEMDLDKMDLNNIDTSEIENMLKI